MPRFHRPANRISIVVATCVAVVVGVWLGERGILVSLLLVGIVATWTLIFWRSAIWWIGVIVLAGAVGMWRADQYGVASKQLTVLTGQTIALSGTAITDPVTNDKHQTQVRISSLRYGDQPLTGIVKVTGYSLRLVRGYHISVTGKLKPGFATWDGEIDYGKVTVTSDHLSPLERFRQNFFNGMRTAVPDPEAAFGLGLLVGVGALIPKPLQLQLTRVGLSHLTAVSGYNLTIIIRLLMRILGRLGPNVVMILALWLIATFVVIAGASASIVRAGAIAYLSLLSSRSGLRIAPTVLIAVTAAVTLLYNPAYLHDAGWALSFLAFFGILVVAPAVMERFGEPSWVLGRMLIETLAAELMTLPYIMVVFHQMSLIGLLANILVEPVIPLAMAMAAGSAFTGMWFPTLMGPVGYLTEHFLGLILSLIATFAALTWAQIEISLSITGAIVTYTLIALIIWVIAQRSARRARFGIIESDRSTQCLDTQNGPP